jgi:hypothetical protein
VHCLHVVINETEVIHGYKILTQSWQVFPLKGLKH